MKLRVSIASRSIRVSRQRTFRTWDDWNVGEERQGSDGGTMLSGR